MITRLKARVVDVLGIRFLVALLSFTCTIYRCDPESVGEFHQAKEFKGNDYTFAEICPRWRTNIHDNH